MQNNIKKSYRKYNQSSMGKERRKRFEGKHREEIREQGRKYRQENKIKLKEYNKKWREENKDKTKKYMGYKKYKKNNPNKVKAVSLARKISLKSACQICNSIKKLERHHWDYNKPLVVATLCKSCHQIQHIKHFNSLNKFNIKLN